MRKIDKTLILAKAYKQWLDNLNLTCQEHPPYTSSKHKFYHDIIANLIWVQHGLCAYTELRLQDHLPFSPEIWKEGVYGRCTFKGELDHYDNTLKGKRGWDWDNLFLVDADINGKVKRLKKPNGILKPDLPDFNPFKLLEYSLITHFFIPCRDLEEDEAELIEQDILCLGLNFLPIVDLRREYLNHFIEKVRYEQLTYDEAHQQLYQFFTAFEMSKSYMEQ